MAIRREIGPRPGKRQDDYMKLLIALHRALGANAKTPARMEPAGVALKQ